MLDRLQGIDVFMSPLAAPNAFSAYNISIACASHMQPEEAALSWPQLLMHHQLLAGMQGNNISSACRLPAEAALLQPQATSLMLLRRATAPTRPPSCGVHKPSRAAESLFGAAWSACPLLQASPAADADLQL